MPFNTDATHVSNEVHSDKAEALITNAVHSKHVADVVAPITNAEHFVTAVAFTHNARLSSTQRSLQSRH